MLNFLISYNEGHELYQEEFYGTLYDLDRKVNLIKKNGAYNVIVDNVA